MGEVMHLNLLVNEVEYELQEKVDDSVFGSEIINDGLKTSRKILEANVFSDVLDRPDIVFDGIYTYDSCEINAVAHKEGGTYIVAISQGVFIKLSKWFIMWKKHPKIADIFGLKSEEQKNVFFQNSYFFAISFITAHEMYHILNGHCDICSSNNSITEEKVCREVEQNMFSQVLEFDADMCAALFCTAFIWSMARPIGERLHTTHCLLFALYNVFYLFNEKSFEELMSEEFDMYDHPHPSIRLAYCLAGVISEEVAFVNVEAAIYDMKIAVNECMEFDRIILESTKLKDCLTTLAYTKKGTNHVNIISKKWRKVEKYLRKHSYIELRKELSEIKITPWVTNNGEFDMSNNINRMMLGRSNNMHEKRTK